MASVKGHLNLFNPQARENFRTFHHFPHLPREIRDSVWEVSSQYERFIQLRVEPNVVNDDQGCSRQVNAVARGGLYKLIVKGPAVLSKLLHINNESRAVTIRHYRVHLPCEFEWGQKAQSGGILYINPELDTIRLSIGGGPLCAATFLVDIRGRDRLGVGLCSLALDHYGIDSLNELVISDLGTLTRSEFINAISNLQNLIVVCLEGRGRMWPNRSGIETVRPWQMHRSRPILGSVTSFDRIKCDPRPISHDLKRVYTGFVDPLRSVYIWFKLLDKWDIPKSSRRQNVNYQFLVAQFGAGYPTGQVDTSVIIDRESAMRWVQGEEATWTELQYQLADNIRAKGKNVPLESESKLISAPKPAIGFWLFPIEVLGEVPGPDASEDCGDWEYKRVINMAAYSPQLCISKLY